MFVLTCEFCNRPFEVKERRHFDGNRKRKYCSQACTGIAIYERYKDKIRETGFQKGHVFYPKGSRKPKIINPPRKLYGSLNPAFKHGRKAGRLGKVYTKLAFDNYVHECLTCKDTKRLHVHHIDGDHFNHSLNNLCILCNSCHQRFHRCQIKLPNPHIIQDQIESKMSSLELKNEFLKIKRRKYLLSRLLKSPNHSFYQAHLKTPSLPE